jgi:heat shock protein HslJ
MAGGMIGLLLALQLQGAVQPPPPSIANTEWAIVAIGQEAVTGPQYVLRIGSAEIGGRAGCNNFAAAYTAVGDVLNVGPAQLTRMACAPAVMAREQRALAILTGGVRVNRPDANSLVLTGEEGTIRLRRGQ